MLLCNSTAFIKILKILLVMCNVQLVNFFIVFAFTFMLWLNLAQSYSSEFCLTTLL